MKRLFSVFSVFSVLSAAPTAANPCGEIILATTTSTQDTGLLDSLLPMFKRETCIEVKPIAVGTGAALEMAKRGDADAVLVHAPEAEKAYVESGDLIDGRRIMHNDFLIIGPASDPAKVRGQKDAAQAMKAIAAGGSFVSRGDGSGTEKKELELWKAVGVVPGSVDEREETGQGMGAIVGAVCVNDDLGHSRPRRSISAGRSSCCPGRWLDTSCWGEGVGLRPPT